VFDEALMAALARRNSPEAALARAQGALRDHLAREAADSVRPEAIAQQQMGANPRDGTFDAVVLASLARGLTPGQAIERANARRRNDSASDLPDRPATLNTALSSGAGLNQVSELGGRSNAYRAALGKALAQGRSLPAAVAIAQKAEQAATVTLPLPREIRDLIDRNPSSVELTTAGKGALPEWLRLDVQRRQLVAVDIPDAGLPVIVVLTVGKSRYAVTVSEIMIPGVPPAAKID
jgi:hypothetical protein